MVVTTLKRRAEFLRLRGGGRSATEAFVLEGKRRVRDTVDAAEHDAGLDAAGARHASEGASADEAGVSGPRFGFTVTRKIGNAVVRNRIRRRLKAAVLEIADEAARGDCDYVVIARRAAETRPFADLKADLKKALARVNAAVETVKSRRK